MIKNSTQIEKKILEKITPSFQDKKRIQDIIQDLKKRIEKEIKKYDLQLSIELVGSTAKGTFLKDNADIDLFILFPKNVSRNKLQQVGLSLGRSILKNQEECFAEHPYIRGTFNDFKTEIVPCYKIESASQKLSAVDRTPLHTKYIQKHLLKSQRKEVLLFKQFLRGIGCYGAETEIEGFSGYLCEILIIKYSTFQSLIINAQNWNFGKKISLKNGKIPDFDTPLIFIDPVDSERNVSSALSKEKFSLFIIACREYTKNPRITFFFPNQIKPWTINKIKKKIEKNHYIGIKIKKPSIIQENLYPQVRKAIRSIKELCERYGFTILDNKFHISETSIFMILLPKSLTISKTKIHMGPPIIMKKNSNDFINRWNENNRTIKKPYKKNGRLYVEIERVYTNIEQLFKEEVKKLNLGKHLNKIVQNNFIILKQEDLLIESLREFWTINLDKKMSWER